MALTFDDGPGPYTEAVLAALARSGVKATFFVTGRHVQEHPELARRIAAEGHLLANHSYSHPLGLPGSVPRANFDDLPPALQAEQVDRTTEQIVAVTGQRPCFFRGPGGSHFSAAAQRLARSRDLRVVHWSHDTRDYLSPPSASRGFQDAIVRRATTPSARHPVVLLHDAKASPEPEHRVSSYRGNTAAAVERVVAHYRSRGHVFTDPAGRPPAP